MKKRIIMMSVFFMLKFTCSVDSKEYYEINLKNIPLNQSHVNNENSASALSIAFSFTGHDHFFLKIIDALSKGNQINSITIAHNKNKKELYDYLMHINQQFYIYFYVEGDVVIWKLYSVCDQKFITGKSYKKNIQNELALMRTVCIDIWQELFSEKITPFQSFLCYIDTSLQVNKKQKTQIKFCLPLLEGFEKTLLNIPQNILDLASIDSTPHQSLIFSIQNNADMIIVKLNAKGKLIPIIKKNEMIISPSVNEDGLFYLSAGLLYRYYYNKIAGKFESQLLDIHKDYASVYAVTKQKKLLVSRNKKIYSINYDIDQATNKLIIIEAHQISEDTVISLNMTYDYNDQAVIVSQKLNGYCQLIYYAGNEKIILTNSAYHKQDPAISPCGNYIAYVAQNTQGERFVEVINKYTKKTIRITPLAGEYRFPVWLEK